MAILESNIGGLWVAKQSAKGTAAATPEKRLNWSGGDLSPVREDGREPWVATERFGKHADYVDSLSGVGDPQIPALPGDLSYLCYLFFGGESVTGGADPYAHTFVPTLGGGYWSTWWKSIGGSVIQRQRFADMIIGQLQIEGSTGSKVVKATPTLLGLDPAEVITSDPATSFSAGNPLLYTEGEGAFKIGGSVFRGQSQFSVTWNENLSLVYSDAVTAYDVIRGEPEITVTISIYLDADGLKEYNKLVYGSATPAATTKPLKFLPANGSYEATLTQKDASGPLTPARSLKIEVPGVKWTPDVSVAANPSGGATEIQLTGSARKAGGAALSTVTVVSGDVGY